MHHFRLFHLSPAHAARLSRRQWLVALLSAWPVAWLGAWDMARLQQRMQSQYGARGVQALQSLEQMIQSLMGQSIDAQLRGVNNFWNQHVRAVEDIALWGQTDYWATPLESLGKGAGDCEDYVIGKYFSLLKLGVPPDALRLIYVRAQQGGQSIAHMVLGYYEQPNAQPLVLDNLVGRIAPANQRRDLTPVFSFNAHGIYVQGNNAAPAERINRWQSLLSRMSQEGW